MEKESAWLVLLAGFVLMLCMPFVHGVIDEWYDKEAVRFNVTYIIVLVLIAALLCVYPMRFVIFG